jgi:hypothetical protein
MLVEDRNKLHATYVLAHFLNVNRNDLAPVGEGHAHERCWSIKGRLYAVPHQRKEPATLPGKTWQNVGRLYQRDIFTAA